MGKFADLLIQMDKIPDKVASLQVLEGLKKSYQEGVDHYAKKELLNDWWQEHYTNARKSLERKIEQIDEAIRKANVGVQTKEGTTEV